MTQVDDLSRSLAAFDQITSLVVVVKLSKTSWQRNSGRVARDLRDRPAGAGERRAAPWLWTRLRVLLQATG